MGDMWHHRSRVQTFTLEERNVSTKMPPPPPRHLVINESTATLLTSGGSLGIGSGTSTMGDELSRARTGRDGKRNGWETTIVRTYTKIKLFLRIAQTWQRRRQGEAKYGRLFSLTACGTEEDVPQNKRPGVTSRELRSALGKYPLKNIEEILKYSSVIMNSDP